MRDWLDEWSRLIRPLRLRYGFEIHGPWIDEEQNQFIWILHHDGPGTYEAANTAYYEAAERKAMSPDPARHLARIDHRPVRPVT